mgnify:CR=1 FL=1
MKHFDFIGDTSTHYGIFEGCGKSIPYASAAEGGKKGLPIRIGGIVVVLALGYWIYSSHSKLSQGALTSGTQSALLAMNGATVDLDSVTLDLADGALRIEP